MEDLEECGCCYTTVPFEQMLTCPAGHLFCSDCIRRSTEVVIGQARSHFPCLALDCSTEFLVSILQRVLPEKTLSQVLRTLQAREIAQAGLEDLVQCPSCDYAEIIPDSNMRVFTCRNPECLKESCRFCREPSHIPLRCDEARQRQTVVDMKSYVDCAMSEAMIRTCWFCKLRFVKKEGCNKMTCSCGASMCYVCRLPVTDYSHFADGVCPRTINEKELHAKESGNAAVLAREKFLRESKDIGVTVEQASKNSQNPSLTSSSIREVKERMNATGHRKRHSKNITRDNYKQLLSLFNHL